MKEPANDAASLIGISSHLIERAATLNDLAHKVRDLLFGPVPETMGKNPVSNAPVEALLPTLAVQYDTIAGCVERATDVLTEVVKRLER